tara:strand:+ start:1252 stop:2025 length:774 start_codon:yes stop_codon:yes gene_type:complete
MEDLELKKNLLQLKIDKLKKHPLLNSNILKKPNALIILMEHHVFAVWDFMSILKALQNIVCPSGFPWKPNKFTTNGVTRLINEIVLAEESDLIGDDKYLSHFDLYIQAMEEIGANTNYIKILIKTNFNDSLDFRNLNIPSGSADFLTTTFNLLALKKFHITASLFTYGRETTLPTMFVSLMSQIKETTKTEKLQLYLERHIDIDSNRHGPLSIQLLDQAIDNDPQKHMEAVDAAIIAIDSRFMLWSSILNKIKSLKI